MTHQTIVLNVSIELPNVLGPDFPIRVEEALSDLRYHLGQGFKSCEASHTVADQPRFQIAFNKVTRNGGFSQNLRAKVESWTTD